MQLHRSMQSHVSSANLLLPSLLVPLVEAFWPSCSLAPLPHIPHSGRRNGWTCALCGNSLGKSHDESHRCCRVAVSANILKSESKTPILGRIHAHWQQILTKLTISLVVQDIEVLVSNSKSFGDITDNHRSFPSLPGAVLIECKAIIRAKRIEMCNECSSGCLKKQLLQSRGFHPWLTICYFKEGSPPASKTRGKPTKKKHMLQTNKTHNLFSKPQHFSSIFFAETLFGSVQVLVFPKFHGPPWMRFAAFRQGNAPPRSRRDVEDPIVKSTWLL